MKMTFALMIALFVLGAAAVAHEEHAHKKEKAQPVALTGEVLDLDCYMKDPEKSVGTAHAKCAKTCISKGLPVGFLTTDGTVYIITGKDHEPVGTLVADWAGKKSMINGVIMEHHGVKTIELVYIAEEGSMKAKAPATYVCSMHPEVRQSEPGKCPKCGMELEPEGK